MIRRGQGPHRVKTDVVNRCSQCMNVEREEEMCERRVYSGETTLSDYTGDVGVRTARDVQHVVTRSQVDDTVLGDKVCSPRSSEKVRDA